MSHAPRRDRCAAHIPAARRRPVRGAFRAACLAALLLAWEAAADGTPPAPVTATWHIQTLSFTFQSRQSMYSCEAVGQKVWRTLYRLGARPDMHINVRGCEVNDPLRGGSSFGFRSASPIELRIELASPYEINPVDRDGATGEQARRDLIEKTTGRLPADPDLAEQFPATWSRIRVSNLDHLEPGDCELVQAMERQLFPELRVRVVENRMSCLPGRQFRGEGLYEVEALLQLQTAQP